MDHSTRGLGTLSSPQRNHYFYGKLMDVPHFEMEQWYGNKKRWLLNRLGLGYGVLCGLGLTIKENKVCIAPGVAIDRYGREIIVPHEVCIDPWSVTDECGRPKANVLSKTEEHQVHFCLAYRECQTDFMPVLVTDCNVQEDCLPGTTVESYLVLVKEGEAPKPTRLEKVCEILNSDQAQSIKRNKLCELLSNERCFLSADNEICVVLGGVRLRADGTIGALDPCSARTTLISNERLFDMLLCLGSPSASGGSPPTAQTNLTTITEHNWPHDGDIALKNFPETLEVTFSDTGLTSPETGRAWFVVTLEWLEGPALSVPVGHIDVAVGPSHAAASANTFVLLLTTLSQHGSFITLGVDGKAKLSNKKAIFNVNGAFLTLLKSLTGPSGDQAKLLCRVVVKCDFLLDGNEMAVDGNYLGGSLPSGDGVPGGDFESWFTVTIPPSPEDPVN